MIKRDEFLSAVPPRNPCFFCRNGKGTRKHRYTHHDYQVAYVCRKCEQALGGPRAVQDLLEKIPVSEELALFKSVEARQ